jgi:ABC-type sulfate/molybdate transport systems ATPase subunit
MISFFHLHSLTIRQTHNVAMASSVADFVVSMGKDGRILSQGSVTDAIAKDTTLAARVTEDEQAIEQAGEKIDVKIESEVKQADGKLVVKEEIEEGHVSWQARACFRLSVLSDFEHRLQ